MADDLSTDFYRSTDADSRDNRDNRGRFRSTLTDFERFWSNVDLSNPSACWPWIGQLTSDGMYGRFLAADGQGVRKYVRAHRYAWLLMRGPIPEGHTLDHLIGPGEPCAMTACVRPSHLEPVSNSENLRRRHERDARRRRMNGATQ